MSILFEPFKIGRLETKNRFIRSATYYALADKNGFVGEKSAALMKNLASLDIGLIVTGYAYIQKNGRCFSDQNGIEDDDHIPGYQKMTRGVHEAGGKIIMQIAHGGIAATDWGRTGGDLMAVSLLEGFSDDHGRLREMTDEDIETIINAFGQAARRVQEAGFDGVQIHGAHGYLVTQFLSPCYNRRSDKWGGSLENRMRFVVETTRAIKKQVGEDFPVLIKLGCRDYTQTPRQLTIEDGIAVVKRLENEGHCHIEISYAKMDKENRKKTVGISAPHQEAYLLPDAADIRRESEIPLGLVGGLRSLSVMEDIVSTGVVDTISISRPLIREPDLVQKWKQGSQKTADCISCGRCFDQENGNRIIRCTQTSSRRYSG